MRNITRIKDGIETKGTCFIDWELNTIIVRDSRGNFSEIPLLV